MVKLTDLISDPANMSAHIKRNLCDHFCEAGQSCAAEEENDTCFCTEAAELITDMLCVIYTGEVGRAPRAPTKYPDISTLLETPNYPAEARLRLVKSD